MTPHIEAKKGDIAKTVIMPGDPLRAQFIAESFLQDAKQYNGIRGMLGYAGIYNGKTVSVQGSGMGIPSMGIYAYELFNFYEVDSIIRVGTAGGIAENLQVKDVVIAQAACTNSNFMSQYGLNGNFSPIADYQLLSRAANFAIDAKMNVQIGNIVTSDTFYSDNTAEMRNWQKMGVLAVEMEAAGLYATAARLGKKALCIVTISDMVFTGEAASAFDRQTAFMDMVKIALNTAQ